MTTYYEARIETERVFCEWWITPVKIKSIERAALEIRWGMPDSKSPTRSKRIVFTSLKKAQDHVALMIQDLKNESFKEYEGPLDMRLAEERKTLFIEALDMIARLSHETPKTARFPPPEDPMVIDLLELDYEILLPESYRAFMARFNGGGFLPPPGVAILYADGTPAIENFFYSLREAEEVHKHYLKYGRPDYKELKAFPIGEYSNGDVLLLKSSGPEREDTRVIDRYDNGEPDYWPQYFATFQDALICYVGRRMERVPFYNRAPGDWAPSVIQSEGQIPG